MKKRYILTGLLAVMLTGCQLNVTYDKVDIDNTESALSESVDSSLETNAKEESTDSKEIISISIEETSASESSTEKENKDNSRLISQIPDMELPRNENGDWDDYRISLGQSNWHHEWTSVTNPEVGEYGFIYDIKNPPTIQILSDAKKQEKYYAQLTEYFKNNFDKGIFILKDMEVDLVCTLHNESSRFISFEFSGDIYHYGDGTPFLDEKEYRYYFTVDRMTMKKVSLDTAYGIDRAINDIKEGNYTVISADDSVFKTYSNELLARAYEEVLFKYEDHPELNDNDHYLDYYFENGNVCVCVWVGVDCGDYAILQLNGKSELIEKKDKSVSKKTTDQKDISETTDSK